jgi:hypothetical protein
MKRPQFTLRALLVAMLVVSIALAVWVYAPTAVLAFGVGMLAFGLVMSVGMVAILLLAVCAGPCGAPPDK